MVMKRVIPGVLLGAAHVSGFGSAPKTLGARSDTCPSSKCKTNELAHAYGDMYGTTAFDCGKKYDETIPFCYYSNGQKNTCEAEAETCVTGDKFDPTDCADYEDEVAKGMCPEAALIYPEIGEGAVIGFCESLDDFTNLRDKDKWCGSLNGDQEACNSAYVTYAHTDADGNPDATAFQKCVYNPGNQKCQSSKQTSPVDNVKYSLVSFCPEACEINFDDRANLNDYNSDASCGQGSLNDDGYGNLGYRVQSEANCEEFYHEAAGVQIPCQWEGDTAGCTASNMMSCNCDDGDHCGDVDVVCCANNECGSCEAVQVTPD